jgi:uncharacterized protein (DUF2062 family)
LRERLRIFFLPRRNYRRSFKYFGKRVIRLSASPHAIAAGVAAGAAASCTPFIGFHFLLSFAIAFVLRGNMVAAAIGTAVGNPLTFPFIWVLIYQIGGFIQEVGRDNPSLPVPENFVESILTNGWEAIAPLLPRMMIGSIPLGLVTGLGFYLVTRWAVGLYQRARRDRIAARRAAQESTVGAE